MYVCMYVYLPHYRFEKTIIIYSILYLHNAFGNSSQPLIHKLKENHILTKIRFTFRGARYHT